MNKPAQLSLAPLMVLAFGGITSVLAQPAVDTACETSEFFPAWAEAPEPVPPGTFQLQIQPDSDRATGNFDATIGSGKASLRLLRPGRACRLELTIEDCPAIGDVAQAFEQLNVPIGQGYATAPAALQLHPTHYRLRVQSQGMGEHELSYVGTLDNPLLEFMHDSRERLLACVPAPIREFVKPLPGS